MERGRLSAEGGREEGTMRPERLLIQSLPEGRRERENNACERKAKKICLRERKEEGRKSRESSHSLSKTRGPLLANCHMSSVRPRHHSSPLRCHRQKKCDSINEMTSDRRHSVLEREPQIPSLGLNHTSPGFMI